MHDYNSKKHHRHSIRLKGYDYSKEGLYFITICTQNRECFFGHVQNKQMVLNDAGIGIGNEWIANYIINNPEKWDDDQLNAKNPIK
jgi:hypothetical protein